MRRGTILLGCLLVVFGTAMGPPADNGTALFRADAQAAIMVFGKERQTDTQGGPGMRHSRAQVSAQLVSATAASNLLQEEVAGDTRAASVGPLPDSLADSVSGLWDTLTITDLTLPQGHPLEITVTVALTGYRSPLVGGTGEARAGDPGGGAAPAGPVGRDDLRV